MNFSGKRLKAAREFLYKTMDGLIEVLERNFDLKINRGMVSRWENGKATPRQENIKALSTCLCVSTDFLSGRNSFGNTLLYLRLVNRMTVKELSEKSRVPEKKITLVETEIGYLTELELKRVGQALNITDLRSYVIKEEGVSEPITREEHDLLFSNAKTDFYKRTDLHFILSVLDKEVYYDDRLLSSNERYKIKKIIEILLNDDLNH